uniref:amino acid adenylation domain-containing protein n=1 Tax=Pseudomonas viciae TaxID=2505979 RepID=UPI003878298D
MGGSQEVQVPANLIPDDCSRITPDLLPLATLSQDEIDRVVATVPGGVGNVQDIYALAPLQEGILYHHLAAAKGDPYLQYVLFAFDSRAHLDTFAQALQNVVSRHDILRTAVVWEGLDDPVQVVWREAQLELEEIALDAEAGDIARQLREHLDPRHYRLDIRRAPMMRIGYAQDVTNNRWVGMLLFHHMVDDATSLGMLTAEIGAYMAGNGQQLAASVPYRNYVAQARLGVSREDHEAFFREMLGDVTEPTLPFGLQNVQGDGHDIEEVRQRVDAQLSRRLRVQARQLGVSAASLYHLAWAQVLGKVSGQDDVVFGTVLLGRMQGGEGADRALGMFINTLPLRVGLGAQGVRAGVKATHARLTALLGHEHASLVLAQRCSGVATPTPLFSALLNYRHLGTQTASSEIIAAWNGIQTLEGEERTNYPLTLSVDDLGEDFNLTVMAQAPIGAGRVCSYVNCALENLVRALEQSPLAPLHGLAILPPAERRQLLETWNTTDALYADDSLIHGQFEVRAAAQPDAVAVVFEDRTLTYGELNARANRVAHRLLSLGIRPDDRVAICVERGLDMIVGLLGILKSGAGYVPVDPAYPAERIAYLLRDSAPMAVLAQAATYRAVAEVSVPVLALDDGNWQDQSDANPQVPGLDSSHLAYVIYTSGSTGLPKGVMVEHRNVTRLFSATQPWFDFGPHDVWALFHSFAFDFSVWEIWGALTHGGRLLVVPQWVSRSPQDCYALLCEADVTVLNQTPSAFRQLIAAQGESDLSHSLRQVIFGGEALETGILKPWYARGINAGTQLVNMYGITETTVHVTYRPLTAADAQLTGISPIGKRIPDLQLYVLDAQREPVPVGVVGEMYVGGAGVSRGYLNREALTAERFLDDPFSTAPNARLYRTGDLGRWLADGSIEYLGRNDDQVKIRGFRIELGEIEAALAACEGVSEAVVIAREDESGEKRLVAYVIAGEDAQLSAADLRTQLLASLAEYMVPSAFVTLAAFPLTTNGKLDRKALPAPDQSAVISREYQAPQGEVEVAIARIWQDLLKIEQIGRHDNFFELGGHSLLAVKLIERMRQVDLAADVRVLFGQPTLAALAAAVGGHTEVVVPDNAIPDGCMRITPDMLPLADLGQAAIDRIVATVPGGVANVQDIYALAPLQEGILYHHLAAEQGDPYVLQVLFGFDNRERLQAFAHALQSVVSRNDILRTSMVWQGLEAPVQVVWRHATLGFEEIEVDPAGGDVVQQLHERFDPRHYRLDIAQAPLMRLAYAQDLANQRWVGILLFHHMALDHTALEVVVHEMQASLLGQAQLLSPAVPYRNHVAQARLGVSREQHEAFFRDMLADIDEPTLPFGLQDVQGDGSGIEEQHLDVDAELAQRLRMQARQLGVSAASLVHLAWAQVVGRVSGREEVVFGTVLMGRMQGGDGADRALGMFINTLPLRVSVGGQGARAGVRATHGRLSALLGHEHASLSLAQRCSGVPASLPLFSTLLNYRHSAAEAVSDTAISAWHGIQTLSMEERTNYPLCLNVDDLGEGFRLTAQTVVAVGARRVCGYMHTALESLVMALEHTPDLALRELSIVPATEREQLLVTFNATEADYPRQQTIHGLFEEQVQRTPDAVAVRHGRRQLNYRELNGLANRLAHYLRKQGVQPDSRVAICVERGIDMVVGLLAILKAGGGYVPLDPAYPQDRIAYMLEDSAPAAILVQGTTRHLLGEMAVPVVDLDQGVWQDEAAPNPQVPGLTSSHLAYVIYTSGSTGLPKGVMIEHRNTVNFLTWAHRSFDDATLSKTLFSTSLNFDLAVYECFAPLTSGGSIEVVTNVLELQQGEHDITLINTVPSALKALLESGGLGEGVDTVNVAGEALKRSLVETLFEQTQVKRLCNLYGPSETTTYSSWVSMAREDGFAAHIGKPVANTQFYLLDEHQQPVPLGVPGEIYIGGAGVARGYLNRDDLTAERFLKDPFSTTPNTRMYRTGDLGRYLADGNIEYLGRNDDQVKIRGFRIELGEIEAKLAQHPALKEAVVQAREDVPGDKRLVAYFTEHSPGDDIDVEALRSHLQIRLPAYMVPSAYVRLGALPLTPNGKLDRKALPAPDQDSVISRGYEAPQGEFETTLSQIWQNLLGLQQVGRHDQFFELGGHSLLAIQLISQVRLRLGVELSLAELFAHPQLMDLAQAVAHAGRSTLPEIVQVSGEEDLPLSFAQQRLWFLAQMEGASVAYHMPAGLRLRGILDRVALQRALDRIVARHEALRTTFVQEQGQEARQCVAPADIGLALFQQDLSDQDDAEGHLQALLAEEATNAFDLEHGPLIRGRLIRLGSEDHVLLVTMHHIVSDGWSIGVLIKELAALYEAFRHGLDDPLPALAVQYSDYAVWQRRWLSGEVLQTQSSYWQQALADAPALLMLPTDRARPPQQDYTGAALPVAFDADLTASLKALSQRHGVTLYMTLMAAWGALLSRLSGQDEVVIGSPVANRTRSEVEGLIGLFVNTLAVRVDVSGAPTVETLLARVKTQALGAQAHQDLPFEQVVEVLKPVRSLAHTPLFQAMLSWQTVDNTELVLGDLKLEGLGAASTVAKFDLSLELGEAQGQMFGALEYATALFDETTVQRYLGYFERLLRAMVAGDQSLIERVALLDEAEREHLLVDLNATQAAYPRGQTIHQLFEAQVAARPDAIAVLFEGERLSYAELNRQANQLAHHLIGLGIRPDDRVAICVERGAEMLVGLLAILKAGAGYVPLDPAYPAERLAYMLADSAPVALLTQGGLQGRLPALTVPVVLLDHAERVRSGICVGRDDNPLVASLGVRHLAYVIYTSGSTGNPKGVMIEHRGLVNYCVDAVRLFGLTAADTVLQQNTLNFDLSVEEIFPALLAGATLAPTRQLFGSAELQSNGDVRPTFLHLTAAHWHTLAAEWHNTPALARDLLRDVRLINVTGDALSTQKLQMWDAIRPPHTQLINTYGPTEATVSCTAAYMKYDAACGNATIGTPMANTRIYLLDGHRQPVPFGVAGEIFIGGEGVARGYLNLDAINAERFLADPFSDQPDARMYKTGDLARYRADGRLEYLGRNDFQVKVRGFRIELGEIESRLGHCAGVKEAAVIVREDTPGDKRLVAYVVPQADASLNPAALRAQLSMQLAEYMLPSAFVSLSALPLTPNRKLDRQALPAPDAEAYASRSQEAPQGQAEIALAQIWRTLLKVESVGRHDHFFELGGHSLLVMRLIAQVREQLGVELNLSDVFAQPQLSALAQILSQAARSTRPDIVPVSRDQVLPLSFAQQRLWFLAQLDGGSAAYHIPTGLRLRGALDMPALTRALDRIVARHEALRTTFVQAQGQEAQQRIAPADIGFALQRHVLAGRPDAEAELLIMAEQEARQAFDLARGPLARGRLVRMADDDHVLLVTLHHIVADGWSADVLTHELGVLYEAFSQDRDDPLPALPIQYADYALWQRHWLTGEVLEQQERYWQQTLADVPALLTLPTDRPRPAQQDHAGSAVGIALDESLTENLKALSQRHGATLFMTVMAAWAAVLSRMAGQDDVVIGTPVANRMQSEVEGLIGLFVNTLALRVDVAADLTVQGLLQQVKAQTLGAQAHQDLPFEQVVEVVRPLRSLSHSPVFQAMLSWQNNESTGLELGDISLQGLGVTSRTAKFDVLLDMALIDGRLFGSLEYATALFDQATMERYLGYLECVLRAMVADEQAIVAQIPLLGDNEREHLLEGFNATTVEYPSGLTLHGLFEARVATSPDAVAVVSDEEQLSYAQLNRRANQVAHRLLALGIRPDDRVAICVDRSVEMVAGLLGILKAGAAYVPLDPDYPLDRLAYMLENSAPTVVLTQRALQASLPATTARVMLLDAADEEGFSTQPTSDPLVEGLQANHLAYVIYTSGSTGQPKGVMNEHGAVVNRLLWMQDEYKLTAADAVLQKTPFSFDVSVWEFFWPLFSGARLVMARPGGHREPAYLREVIQAQGITTLHFVPSMLDVFLAHGEADECASLLRVMCSGEALPGHLVRRFKAQLPQTGLYNLYGPTEAAVDVTAWDCAGAQTPDSTPIGKPIANTRIYLLDAHQQPVPMGVAGEIYIGGVQVARGYLHRAELTAERFLKDPFSTAPNARMYKTGDLGRYLPDGNVDYLGRNDDQVKIRGFRIELGEIEARLAQYAGIKETVVLAREEASGEKRLVAYFTTHAVEAAADIEALRAHLQGQLPEYMVPSAYVRLDALPLTPNGKLDRKALPAPDLASVITRDYEAPQGTVETTLAQLWADLLQVERVGRHDHFFELGGHSLLAVTLIERMRQVGLSADVRVLFGQPTLAALAAAVGGTTEVVVPDNAITQAGQRITPDMLPLIDLSQDEIDQIAATVPGGEANVQDIYALAPLQEGILYHHLASQQGDLYVQQATFNFKDRGRLQAFVDALQAVIDRHDILRTAVLWEGLREPVQVVLRQARLILQECVFEPSDDITAQLLERFNPRHYSLDVRQAPLMRMAFAHDPANQRWIAMLLFHHMALDHTALEVVQHEMQAHLLGQADQLGAAVPFRNYVAQARLGISREEHEGFFRDMLGDVDEPTLPFGVLDVHGDGSDIETAGLNLSADLSRRLRAQARQLGVSAASLHHLAWAHVLGQVSGKQNVVFGTVLMGRMQGGEGADRALGMFINTLPLRVDLGSQGVRDGVKATHARLSGLLGHEHASLALAQRCSGVAAPLPLFSALLNYRHSAGQTVSSEALSAWEGIEALSSEERTNYPLTLSVDDLGEGFSVSALALPRIGAQRMCVYMNIALEHLVQALEQAPQAPLSSVSILPSAERRQLLVDFNATTRRYPRDRTVQGIFEAQVLARPDATAVVHDAYSLSYVELNHRANRLARHLVGLGVQPGDRVAIALERSLELLVSQLAILKCAAAYVPLDISAPLERQQFMVQDSGAQIVLTLSTALAPEASQRVDLDTLAVNEAADNLDLTQSTESVAYIMYTSGSTGTPKGVLVPHRAINRLVINNGYADFNAEDRVAFASNPAFDASTLDVWAPLLNGGCVVVVDQDVLLTQERFAALLQEQSVSVLWMTAGLFHQYAAGLMSVFAQLRYLIVGGDVLDPAVIGRVLKEGAPAHLLNGYGPTEATTFTTTHEIKTVGEGGIPIGRPIGNSRVYVLDANRQPVPIGVAGELYIGGDGVAKGYLNRPELTAEKFVADPFNADPGALLYRTGDLARWRADGTVDYLGRNDDQVKIRGFRIELGEIEARLNLHDEVKEAVVLVREDVPGEKRLVAYFTQHAVDAMLPVEDLRGYLQAQLPEYMLPSAFVALPAFSLTANGKLDRRALPAPDQDAFVSRAYEAPQGEVETLLAQLWQDLLGLQRVGRHDNFFEMGGHSLLAIRLVGLLAQANLTVSLAELFQHESVASMASLLQNRTTEVQVQEPFVPVRTTGQQNPLFLVHEFSGLDLYFPVLGKHIDPDIPVYGLPAIAWGEPQLHTMECLASRLVGIIRSVQPKGPYRLAGWSFGGVLAYEIAIQLIGLDEEVEFLGLIDSYLPRLVDQGRERWSPDEAHKRHLLDRCEVFWRAGTVVDGDLTLVLTKLASLQVQLSDFEFEGLVQRCAEQGLLPPELADYNAAQLWQYLDREVAHGHALAHYSVYPISVPVHLLVAEEHKDDAPEHSGYLGWDAVLPKAQIHCVKVPGNHQTMMQAPQVKALGQAIDDALRTVASRPAPSRRNSYQPLLTIQGGRADRAPIFCVPGAGDSVTGFIGLTDAFGPDWPIHGLQPRGLDGNTEPFGLVETAAQAYLEAIDKVQPQGPVHLLGHSFGGWIVFEMAARLHARGRKVASLTLIDSESPGGNGVVGRPYTATGVLNRLIEAMQLASGKSLGIDATFFGAQDDTAQMRLLHAGMVRAGMLPQRSAVDSMRGPARAFGTALRTVYQPQHRYTGPVRLVLANDPTLDTAGNKREQEQMIEGWRKHIPDLSIWYGPGNHFTILKAPHVHNLAAWWQDSLPMLDEEAASDCV